MENSLEYDILSVSERAKNDLKSGNKIINGSIGVLLDNNKVLVSYQEINSHLKNNLEKYLDYSSMSGNKNYKDGILKWIFGDYLDTLTKEYNSTFVATSGGTDAIFTIFSVLKNTHTVLLSDSYWPNYNQIAKQAEVRVKKYHRYDSENKFNFDSLKEAANKIDEKILLVINDPCHNPTGYNLSNEEYLELFNFIKENDQKIDILFDIAYIDYSTRKEEIVKLIAENKLNSSLYFSISCSKSFGFYGLRLGGLFALSAFPIEELKNQLKGTIRGTISSANHPAMGALAEFFNDERAMKSVKEKILKEGKRVNFIGKELHDLLVSKGFNCLPYREGFFLTFIKENAKEYLKELEKKHIYFTLSGDSNIRVAICSLNETDLKALKEVL